jgi:hypothetical protein
MDDEELKLGGNITLVGFRKYEPSKMIVVKKIVGNYIKKVQDRDIGFEKVSIGVKNVHNSEVEIKCNLLIDGKSYNSKTTGFNLFIVLNEVMSNVMKEAGLS